MNRQRQFEPATQRQHRASVQQRYPQSTLVRSLLDRRLMGLADRGGASGFVGQAWGEICRTWLNDLTGRQIAIGPDLHGTVQFVVDLDSMPGLALFASNRGLPNPDFVLGIRDGDDTLLVAADAKFSIETAKPKQVSAGILTALLESPGTPITVDGDARGRERDGFFISPDFELTRLVMTGTVGILRTRVDQSQVCLLEVDPERLFGRSDLHECIATLSQLDDSQSDWRRDLVAALYYGRCAFACIGARFDIVKPLLGRTEHSGVEDDGLRPELVRRGQRADSAWQVVRAWDRDAEEVRAIRTRVHQAAELTVAHRDLRELVDREAKRARAVAPSMNKIRRELALWLNAELEKTFGMIAYPVSDLDDLLKQIRKAVTELQPQIPGRVRGIITGLVD